MLLGGLAGIAATAVTWGLAQLLVSELGAGVLIALVLAVMTGTTVHVMQGLGWLPSSPTGFTVPLWANRWLGIYATWEEIASQLAALVSWSAPTSWRASYSARGAARTATPLRGSRRVDGPRADHPWSPRRGSRGPSES